MAAPPCSHSLWTQAHQGNQSESLYIVSDAGRAKYLSLAHSICRYRRALAIGVGLATLLQCTGINTVIYYAPEIFAQAGFSSQTASLRATVRNSRFPSSSSYFLSFCPFLCLSAFSPNHRSLLFRNTLCQLMSILACRWCSALGTSSPP